MKCINYHTFLYHLAHNHHYCGLCKTAFFASSQWCLLHLSDFHQIPGIDPKISIKNPRKTALSDQAYKASLIKHDHKYFADEPTSTLEELESIDEDQEVDLKIQAVMSLQPWIKKCPACYATVFTSEDLDKHFQQFHSPIVKLKKLPIKPTLCPFDCKNAVFVSKKSFNLHLEMFHSPSVKLIRLEHQKSLQWPLKSKPITYMRCKVTNTATKVFFVEHQN